MSNYNYSACGKLTGNLAAAALAVFAAAAQATDIEPRAYANIPTHFNFLVAGYSYTSGSVSFAPTLPIRNGELDIHSAFLAYAHSLDVWGRSGKVDVILPVASLSGHAELQGVEHSRDIAGFGDPMLRLYLNLYGAPALAFKDFAGYRQDLIVGASLAVIAPGGQYDAHKLVNIGTNRWSFKPEIGISKAWGPLIAELAAGAYVFTDNRDPFLGNTLQQEPLYTAQGHLIYSFGHGIWAAVDANYYTGGNLISDGVPADDHLESWRVGGTLALPLSRRHSLKFYGSTGIYSRTGSNFDIIGIAFQYRWGEGF
ncbi:MAG: transporter [Gammaproteobacteria bacterium]